MAEFLSTHEVAEYLRIGERKVYELLRNDVPVRWAIRGDKLINEADFTASATDVLTADPIPMPSAVVSQSPAYDHPMK